MLLSTSDLLARGLTHTEIRRRLRAGQLFRLSRGRYSDTDPATLDPEAAHLARAEGLLSRLAPGSVLSHATAGVLHGLWLPAARLRHVHVTRPVAKDSLGRHVHAHARVGDQSTVRRMLGSAGPVEVTDLLTTTVALLRTLPMPEAVSVADSALRAGLERPRARERLRGLAGRAGVRRARIALAFGDARSESPGESQSRWAMHVHRIPAPVLQHEFFDDAGGWVARSDFWWPAYGLVGEFDGRAKYGRLLRPGQDVQAVVLAERAREVALTNLGHAVTRWGWAALDPSGRLAAQLTSALGRRAA